MQLSIKEVYTSYCTIRNLKTHSDHRCKIMKTNPEETKKKNKRSYTCMALKDALLKEMAGQPFEKIGVVRLCKTASISRSAFYLHYKNVEEVLDELVDEVARAKPDIVIKLLLPYEEVGKGKKLGNDIEQSSLPERDDYSILMQDNIASNKLVDTIAENYLDSYTKEMSDRHGLSAKEAKALFFFQIGGFITASNCLGCGSFDDVKKIRKQLDKINKKLRDSI